MATISTFADVDDATCAVTVFEDTDPVMVHIVISGATPLKLTMSEAVAVREAAGEAIDLFLDVGDEEETVH
jgi:hypothetical protein